MSETLKTVTLKSLIKSGVITAISKLHFNTSGYPYVTFLQGNKPNNVYFTLKSSSVVEGTFQKDDNITSFLRNAEIVQTKNEAGEVRFKLSIPDLNNYSSKSELMEIFGMEESTTDFDLSLFKAQCTTQTAVVPAEVAQA